MFHRCVALVVVGLLAWRAPLSAAPEDWNDCNQNGVEDAVDIAYGTSADLDRNGVPDECQTLLAPWGRSTLRPWGRSTLRRATLAPSAPEPPEAECVARPIALGTLVPIEPTQRGVRPSRTFLRRPDRARNGCSG